MRMGDNRLGFNFYALTAGGLSFAAGHYYSPGYR